MTAVKKAFKQAVSAKPKPNGQDSGNLLNGNTLGITDLSYLISLKASSDDLINMEASKANKCDTEQLLISQCVIAKQIKNLAILFMESIRNSVENPKDSKITKENNRKFLLNQTRVLVNNWIIKFDPMKQNTTQKDEGLEFLSNNDGENLLDYTGCIVKDEKTSYMQNT